MANEDRKPQVSAPAAPAQTIEQLLAATLAQLAESNRQNAESNQRIAALMEDQAKYNKAALRIAPRRKKSMGEYLAERKKAGRSKHLPHEVYQNGRLVNPSGLSQKTIDVLDTLNTGRYCEGLIDVIRISDGLDGVNSRIHLLYNNKTTEERMNFYMKFRTFTEIVEAIAAEMTTRGIAFVNEKGTDAPEFDFPDEMKELV